MVKNNLFKMSVSNIVVVVPFSATFRPTLQPAVPYHAPRTTHHGPESCLRSIHLGHRVRRDNGSCGILDRGQTDIRAECLLVYTYQASDRRAGSEKYVVYTGTVRHRREEYSAHARAPS